jgi:hypothetical protein
VTARNSDPIDSALLVLDTLSDAYRHDPAIQRQAEVLRRRLDEPLRVALVGSLKAGKSTMLNAMLGERAAPTDARECTKVVTWYHHGVAPAVRTRRKDGSAETLPARRRDDRLELELDQDQLQDLDRLEITWPADLLDHLTLIDTPGTNSATDGVSDITDEFLMPEDGAAGADAVIYLLRSLHAADVRFLTALHERTRHGVSAVGAIAVLSRVDELGSGGLGAMVSVNQAVARLQNDPALAGVCETVLPVAGLLGLGAATLRQSDFVALSQLNKADRQRVRRLMASAELFIAAEDPDLPDQRTRAALIERLGLYGVRLALATLRGGVDDAPGLAAELSRRSGIDELRRCIDVYFVQRRVQLKAHSVVLAALRVARANPTQASAAVIARAEEHLADAHSFRELQLIGRVVAKRVSFEPDQLAELERVLGGRGTSPADRLGQPPGTPEPVLQELAIEHLRRWRALAENPLLEPETSEACQVAARSCEAILAEVVDQSAVA